MVFHFLMKFLFLAAVTANTDNGRRALRYKGAKQKWPLYLGLAVAGTAAAGGTAVLVWYFTKDP